MFGPFGWAKAWQKQQEKAAESHPCEWDGTLFIVPHKCDAEGTTEIDGHHYCDEHAAEDKEYGRVKPYSL